ncbi:helix-turn-helix domain-containing protein [Sphingobacterium lumbrici]|uniref:helix-turn-helix domain-containing protein n=1 Tax=Sphingobacterium lumbrici TaxID=2559600 RepID=UPI00112BFE00|nr:AraC family transcriptional regulator [Sphingobacterium lumbrici]
MYNNDIIITPQFTTDTISGSSPKNLFLNFMTAEDAAICDEKNYLSSKHFEDLHVIETKGLFETDWHFELLPPSCFWLVFQFIGHSERVSTTQTTLSNGEYIGFYSRDKPQKIQMKAGKTWMVLMGIKIDDAAIFTSEWPLLATSTTADHPPFSAINIGYRVKQVFEKIKQYTASPFSLQHKICYHLCQLIDIYHEDLKDKVRALQKEDLALYHQATLYIRDNYMDKDINRDKIAEVLNVSVRNLYRAFEGKDTNIKNAIQIIRLHKARELLRDTKMTVDGIAFRLHFSTAKYFYRQYMQLFGHSPSKERELHIKSKKKKR